MAASKVVISGGQKSFRKVFFVGSSAQNVFVYVVLDLGFHFGPQCFYYFGGGAQDQGIGWDDHALGHHGVGTDDAVFAYLGMVEHGGMHSNQDVVR